MASGAEDSAGVAFPVGRSEGFPFAALKDFKIERDFSGNCRAVPAVVVWCDARATQVRELPVKEFPFPVVHGPASAQNDGGDEARQNRERTAR